MSTDKKSSLGGHFVLSALPGNGIWAMNGVDGLISVLLSSSPCPGFVYHRGLFLQQCAALCCCLNCWCLFLFFHPQLTAGCSCFVPPSWQCHEGSSREAAADYGNVWGDFPSLERTHSQEHNFIKTTPLKLSFSLWNSEYWDNTSSREKMKTPSWNNAQKLHSLSAKDLWMAAV